MSNPPKIVKVYSTKVCPKCKRLKAYLESIGVDCVSLDMEDSETMSELFTQGVFTYNAPVLEVAGVFVTSDRLFPKSELDEGLITELVKLHVWSDDIE